jgi:1,4-alpha-glucan branching enzyme
MVIYQAHVGVYAINKPGVSSNFLDVACKVPYIAALNVNVLQPLPIDEQEQHPGLGYGGADIFSPDFPFVAGAADLPAYLKTLNELLAAKGKTPPLNLQDIAPRRPSSRFWLICATSTASQSHSMSSTAMPAAS